MRSRSLRTGRAGIGRSGRRCRCGFPTSAISGRRSLRRARRRSGRPRRTRWRWPVVTPCGVAEPGRGCSVVGLGGPRPPQAAARPGSGRSSGRPGRIADFPIREQQSAQIRRGHHRRRPIPGIGRVRGAAHGAGATRDQQRGAQQQRRTRMSDQVHCAPTLRGFSPRSL